MVRPTRFLGISDPDFNNSELKAWCAFSGINGRNTSSNGDFTVSSTRLQNITVGVKDIIDVAGIPTKCGSAIHENAFPATVDAACVSLMRAAGAVIVGKTVTTELAMFVAAETRNPVNPNYSPGGSSAGSAAAVAAGHVDIAIGTQTAGSILRPAAYCGVFGFKPSFDVVPRTGVKVQSETLDTVGVFARSIDHCAAWLSAMIGEAVTLEIGNDATTRKLKIASVTNLLEQTTTEMRDALARARSALIAAGHDVVEWALPAPLDRLHEQQKIIQHYESARAYHAERTQNSAQLTPALAIALDEGAAIPHSTYLNALRLAEHSRVFANTLFADRDILLMPAAPGAAPLGLASTGDPIFNRLASILHTPAISIPVYRDKSGMPLGLQLIGARGRDAALLAAASDVCAALAPGDRK